MVKKRRKKKKPTSSLHSKKIESAASKRKDSNPEEQQVDLQVEPATGFMSKRDAVCLFAILCICASLSFHGITNHLFWDDEANTAIFARNFLEHGELTAWDGKNLVSFRNGFELDENLVNAYMPPLQYYVTAASFFLFGEGTFTARLPFVLLGLSTIILIFLLGRRLLHNSRIALVACVVLSLNVPFLLYIRNSRYYALGAFLTVLLFCFFVLPGKSKRIPWKHHIGLSLCICALFLTNYFNAIAAVLFLPCFLLLKTARDRTRLWLLGNAFATSAAMGVYSLVTRNPFGRNVDNERTTSFFEHFFGMMTYYLRDFSFFEFFPALITLTFVLPFAIKKLSPLRGLVKRASLVLLFMLVTMMLVSMFSPQKCMPENNSSIFILFADMRYLVPLIPMGALATAIGVNILWHLSRYVCVPVFSVLILSNVLYWGFIDHHDATLKPKGLKCTLCSYIYENGHDYETGTEKIVNYLQSKPDDNLVLILPSYLSFSPMFYLPNLRYSKQIDEDAVISEEMRKLLPSHVFRKKNSDSPETLIHRCPPKRSLKEYASAFGTVYKTIDAIDYIKMDPSRPEIPWHGFSKEEVSKGFQKKLCFYNKSPRKE